LFVHTQHGMLRIVRFRVGFEHFFHAGHELGVLLRGITQYSILRFVMPFF
jgi:hypothetical protein